MQEIQKRVDPLYFQVQGIPTQREVGRSFRKKNFDTHTEKLTRHLVFECTRMLNRAEQVYTFARPTDRFDETVVHFKKSF